MSEPLRLVVVLYGHSAGVEEDEGDDEPEPVGGLAGAPHKEPEALLIAGHVLVGLGVGGTT